MFDVHWEYELEKWLKLLRIVERPVQDRVIMKSFCQDTNGFILVALLTPLDDSFKISMYVINLFLPTIQTDY